MSFGSQTITIISVTENPAVRDRYNEPQQVRTETQVRGCRFRMLNTQETIDLGHKVGDTWKLTAPAVPAMLNATAADEIRHDGNTYTITGTPLVRRDFSGPHHVTILCERHR